MTNNTKNNAKKTDWFDFLKGFLNSMHRISGYFFASMTTRLMGFLIVTLGLWAIGTAPLLAQTDATQEVTGPPTLRATMLQGELPEQYNSHFMAVEPLIRDSTMVLTLAYDPYDDPQTKGLVNFYVLDEDGMRRYIAGGDIDDLELASGGPVEFDRIGNKLRGSFQDSGRGNYTVVVYNNSPDPASYTLSVVGGVLVENAGQTTIPEGVDGEVLPPSNQPAPAVEEPDPYANLGYVPIRARRVTGELDEIAKRDYFVVDTADYDGTVRMRMTYDPQDVRDLIGKVNFWVLDEDGFRRMVRGDDPREFNVATGFPSPVSEENNVLLASFNPSGTYDYNVVLYNESGTTATYVVAMENAVLVDNYGQTNESKAAAVELAALGSASVGKPSSSDVDPSIGDMVVNPALMGSATLTGQLNQAYEHHYYGLTPLIRDGNVVLTLDFEPRFDQTLAENINFWVVDEDGWRRIVAGARPEDHDIANGAPVQYGPDRGKLRAVFQASGKGPYVVIVFNDSDVPARYSLNAQGGLLDDGSSQTGERNVALP